MLHPVSLRSSKADSFADNLFDYVMSSIPKFETKICKTDRNKTVVLHEFRHLFLQK